MEDKSRLIIDETEKVTVFRRSGTGTAIIMDVEGARVFRRAKIFFWLVSLSFLGANAAQCIKQQQDYENTCFEDKTRSWTDLLMAEPWSLLSLINYISCAILLLVLRTKLCSSHQDVRVSGKLKFFMLLAILCFWVLILSFVVFGFVTSFIEIPTPDPAPFFSIVITGAFMFFMIGIFAALDHNNSKAEGQKQQTTIIVKTV